MAGGTGAGTAVYNQAVLQGPADITNAGGLSPYGTMAQGGNAWEWQEEATPGQEIDHPSPYRFLNGGNWYFAWDLSSSTFAAGAPMVEDRFIGFRVAAVPEPEQYAAVFGVALLGTGVWLRRKKSQAVAAK